MPIWPTSSGSKPQQQETLNLAQAGATPCLFHSHFFTLSFRCLEKKYIPNVVTASKTH